MNDGSDEFDQEDYDLQAGGRGLSVDEIRNMYSVVTKGPSLLVIGPDRVGKTTLVQHLSKLTGIPSFKCPSEKQIFAFGGKSSLSFDYNLTHFIQQTGYRFISDRAYPCELVYSKVFGRETNPGMLGLIDARHAALGTQILLVYSDEPPSEEDDLVPKEKYSDVLREYRTFMEWTQCDVLTVNTSRMLQAFYDGGDISKHVAGDVIELLGW